MGALEAVLLGLIQGLTEFLPVSSSGHLVIGGALLGVIHEGVLFEVAVHAGTLLAVVVVYRHRIAGLVSGVLARDRESLTYTGKLAVATLPAVVAALLARDTIEATFGTPAVAGAALLVTGALLFTTRFTLPRARAPEPGWWAALLIGCGQAVALVPGISRSGATVVVALALGVAPIAAAEFSFLMSIIAVTGAVVLQLPELGQASSAFLTVTLLGGIVAMLSGIGAIWLFVRLLRTRHFHRFAYYAWAAGGLFLVWLTLR